MTRIPSFERLCELAEISAVPFLREGSDVQCNELELARLGQSMRLVSDGLPVAHGVLESATVALAGCAGLKPMSGSDNCRLALGVLAELASINRVLFDPPVQHHEIAWLFSTDNPGQDQHLDRCRDLLRQRLFLVDELIAFADLIADDQALEAPQAFVACAMTGVPPAELDALEQLSGDVAALLAEHNLSVHQPVTMHNPYRLPGAASDPKLHDEDIRRLVRTDLVVAFIDRPSTGLGMVLAYAERSRCLQLIFVRGAASHSPLLLGTTADAEFYEFGEPAKVLEVVADYVARRSDELLARQVRRSRRPRLYGPVLKALRAGLAEPPERRIAASHAGPLNKLRIRELLAGVDALSSATLEEVNSLASLLGLGTLRLDVELSPRQLRTAFAAQRGLRWSDEEITQLLNEARLELARPGTRRLDLDSIEGWKALFDARRRSG